MIHETASRIYELEFGKDDTVVMVDGLKSPLISLQFKKVRKF